MVSLKLSESVSSDVRIPPEPDSVNNRSLYVVERIDSRSSVISKNGISEGVEKSEMSVIKSEGRQALSAMRRGNFTEALCIMSEMSRKHHFIALVHRVYGMVYAKLATVVEDPDLRERNVQSALECACRAVKLSPNSIEFAHFYASLLLDVAKKETDYDQVILECRRALAVKFPIDPAEESLQGENQKKIETAEGRVAILQNELHLLVDNANLAIVSKRLRNLGKLGVIEGVEELEINLDLELALSKMHCGNFTEALSIVIELRRKYANMPSVHCVQGMVYAKVASFERDPSYKRRNLENAIRCARIAVGLSPDSLVFRSFYANLLYEMASNATEYDHVVRKCERALSLKNLADAAAESQEKKPERALSLKNPADAAAESLQVATQEKKPETHLSLKNPIDAAAESLLLESQEKKPERALSLKNLADAAAESLLAESQETKPERALSLKNPADAAAESLLVESQEKKPERALSLKSPIDAAAESLQVASQEKKPERALSLKNPADAAAEGLQVTTQEKKPEKVLSLKNPVDASAESLQEESEEKVATAEGRAAFVKEELLSLVEKANDSSISKWSSNLGKEEGTKGREKAEVAAIKLECKEALREIQGGNSTEALRIMREMSQKYGNKALVFRGCGEVHAEMASMAEDPNQKHKSSRMALAYAREAAKQSPKSIEFAHFYASLLGEMAENPKQYNEVVLECERALSLLKPDDPADDRMQDDDSLLKFATAEERVEAVQEELRALVGKANVASIAKMMKVMGKNEEEFMVISWPKFR